MADAPVTVKDEGFGEATPFILLARCHVKPENKDKWMEAAKVADAGVRESEPGMLHHTWDVDPEDPLMYVWSEVYANDAALLAHLSNPPLQKFVGEHTEWGDGFSIEIYGTLAAATKEAFSATGFSIKYYDTALGYSRVGPESSKLVKDGFGEATPFILLARCHVKPENKDKWMEAAKVADAGVRESEPGMLHHTWDVDPEDPLMYVWSEVYANDAALLAHLSNPPLQKFVGEHTEWGDGFSIEIYGTLAAATKEAFSATGFSIKYYDTALGYSRVGPESSKCSL